MSQSSSNWRASSTTDLDLEHILDNFNCKVTRGFCTLYMFFVSPRLVDQSRGLSCLFLPPAMQHGSAQKAMRCLLGILMAFDGKAGTGEAG